MTAWPGYFGGMRTGRIPAVAARPARTDKEDHMAKKIDTGDWSKKKQADVGAKLLQGFANAATRNANRNPHDQGAQDLANQACDAVADLRRNPN